MTNTIFSQTQQSVIEDDAKYIQVIAAAGSGKTSTMVGVVEHSIRTGLEPSEILVLTFTRKAAGEIRERILRRTRSPEVKVHTFHSFCFQALGKWHPEFKNRKPNIVSPEEKNLFFQNWFKKDPGLVGGIPYELLSDFRNLPTDFDSEWKEELEKDYILYKKREGKLDFEDLVSIFLNDLENEEPWTEASKTELKKILVDEFQDTDSEQLRFLKQFQDSSSILVVGDDSQSIYSFRGTEVRLFLDFPRLFSPSKLHFLNTNYRSLPKIVEVSAIPISKNKSKIPKDVVAHREGKATVGRISVERIQDLFPFLERAYAKSKGELRILCRSNHRIREYERAGIPSDLLLTIHASKGLEFHTIFVDLSEGWNTRLNADSEFIEEERRILYVALSRAKDHLFVIGNRGKSSRETVEDLFYSYFKSLDEKKAGSPI
ncbi:damage-inducible protein [Leptospira perolatii]|uniref:DNA 3'-5' helicase n=1 Tax=Leptospira perolatii TaxID=2023191 RepID=A0A2M9ZLR2_9LEPT|nr:UvrD-helicase domain-containing protein [Leptospira perolatii]PJZ69759.1 damage-inducible protein [Leptospira perolatii]PJZ73026.1 damage-inducible protein [Leptospira perolatii]